MSRIGHGRRRPAWPTWQPAITSALGIALALVACACDRPAGPSEQGTSDVAFRDSAGIRIIENRTPVWDGNAGFWSVDPEPESVLGGLGAPGDSAHLVWYIHGAVPLSDGRVAMLTPVGDHKILVFESSGRLSAAFGRTGRGPGEFQSPVRIQVLPGDTIAVWDQMYGPVYYFGPSGSLLRERRIDLGALVAATRTGNQRPGESVHRPLPDGSFLIEIARPDWRPPAESGVLYRRPTGYVRIDSAYSAHSFGWWKGIERLSPRDWADPVQVPFAPGSLIAAGGDPVKVYVTASHRYEIHQFSATGILQRIIRRTVEPVLVSDDELSGWKEAAGSVNPRW